MKYYSVLWIDDECDKLNDFIVNAEQDGIYITSYKTAKDGLKALKENLDLWDGIILDGKFYSNSENEKADINALFSAKEELVRLQSKRYIPWFVYTGQPDLLSDEMFNKWLNGRRYYAKAKADVEGDEDQMFEDIKKEADKQIPTQVRHKYDNVFGIIPNSDNLLLDILMGMEQNRTNVPEYFNEIRKMIESIAIYLNIKGALPIPFESSNLSECSRYIGGSSEFPVYIQRSFHSCVQVCNDGSHRSEIDKKVRNNEIRYLLRSTIFELLNILEWCKTLK